MGKKRIVVLGGGYGGTYTFHKLHRRFKNDPNVDLRLVSRSNYFISTPLLHEVATGNLLPEHIAEPLRKIFPGPENIVVAEVSSIALAQREVVTSEGPLPYDYLVIALGSETNYRGVPGAKEHTFSLKTLEDAIALKNHFLAVFDKAASALVSERQRELLHFIIVGGGGTGVELAAEMSDFFYETFAEYYDRELIEKVKITLLSAGDDLLPNFERNIRTKSKYVLRKKRIDIKFGVSVIEVREGELVLDTGEVLEAATIIWAAGVQCNTVPIEPPPEREKGRILVNQYLQIPAHPEVFALGDMAAFRNSGESVALPMLAQVAHRQSVGVARNIINLTEGRPVVPYEYKHFGDLVSLGEWMAAGELFGVKLFGHLTWFLWRGVYLSKLLSTSKKLNVLFDWILDLFAPRDISAIK